MNNGTVQRAAANDLQADEKANHRRSVATDGYPLRWEKLGCGRCDAYVDRNESNDAKKKRFPRDVKAFEQK